MFLVFCLILVLCLSFFGTYYVPGTITGWIGELIRQRGLQSIQGESCSERRGYPSDSRKLVEQKLDVGPVAV